jgi:hypothetical protein
MRASRAEATQGYGSAAFLHIKDGLDADVHHLVLQEHGELLGDGILPYQHGSLEAVGKTGLSQQLSGARPVGLDVRSMAGNRGEILGQQRPGAEGGMCPSWHQRLSGPPIPPVQEQPS